MSTGMHCQSRSQQQTDDLMRTADFCRAKHLIVSGSWLGSAAGRSMGWVWDWGLSSILSECRVHLAQIPDRVSELWQFVKRS